MKQIKHLLLIGISTIIIGCQSEKKETNTQSVDVIKETVSSLPDSLSTRRIQQVLDLKKAVADKVWPSFGNKTNEGTLIYFNGGQSEVFFPSKRVLDVLGDFKQHSSDYVITSRTDSIPFHMEVMVSFDASDSNQFYYRNPVEQYASVEEINQFIPSVESTEMWSTMVVHEMFHHFQYNTPAFGEYAEKVISVLPFNSNNIIQLCRDDKKFMALIRKENDLLMQAIATENTIQQDSLIKDFLDARENRMTAYSTENPDLETVENYYIIQEGSARYIEYHSMFIFSDITQQMDSSKVIDDPRFQSYAEFKEIDLNSDDFNYLVYPAPVDYHYTLGFNMMRLLDQLNVEYKSTLLNQPDKGLHEYLKAYINERM